MTTWHHSTSFWLVVNTLVLALTSSYVLEFTPFGMEISNQSDRLDVLDKIDQFDKATPTVLMLGSSLGIFPAALADFKNFGEPQPGADKFLHYCSYRYLDQLLNQSTDPAVKTLNLSHQGGMTSEDLLLLQGALKAGIKPEMVVLLTGPRDFLDHQTNKIGESKLSKALVVRTSDALWNLSTSASSNLETVASKYLPLFLQRDAVTKLLTARLKQTIAKIEGLPYLEKPAPTGGSLETIRDEPGNKEMIDFYTANYKIRYLPIDWPRWQAELNAFSAIVDLCRNKQIPLLIVEMPLSQANRDLLPADFIKRHREKLASIAGGGSASTVLLDLFADPAFSLNDFMDTVHLRSCGGMKLAGYIADTVKKSHLLRGQ